MELDKDKAIEAIGASIKAFYRLTRERNMMGEYLCPLCGPIGRPRGVVKHKGRCLVGKAMAALEAANRIG